jgi:hypothetical protein
MVRVEKGWMEHEFVLFIICRIATYDNVAKWENILQDRNNKNSCAIKYALA